MLRERLSRKSKLPSFHAKASVVLIFICCKYNKIFAVENPADSARLNSGLPHIKLVIMSDLTKLQAYR